LLKLGRQARLPIDKCADYLLMLRSQQPRLEFDKLSMG